MLGNIFLYYGTSIYHSTNLHIYAYIIYYNKHLNYNPN